jgi:hypothetical protein
MDYQKLEDSKINSITKFSNKPNNTIINFTENSEAAQGNSNYYKLEEPENSLAPQGNNYYKNIPIKYTYSAHCLVYSTLIYALFTGIEFYLQHIDINIFITSILSCVYGGIHSFLTIYCILTMYRHKKFRTSIINSFSEVRTYLYSIQYYRNMFMAFIVLIYDLDMLSCLIIISIKNEIDKTIIYLLLTWGTTILFMSCFVYMPSGKNYIYQIGDVWYKRGGTEEVIIEDY